MTRKSPIKHHVRNHRRKGRVVHDYDRGHGKRRDTVSKPRLQRLERTSTDKYLVNITYTGRSAESFPVTAASYPDAIESALSARTHIELPYQITVDKQ